MAFKDRHQAGELLAEKLQEYKDRNNVIILAIPRGTLQIRYSLAKELNVDLDIALVKKIGAPGEEDFAIGAVSLEGEVIDLEFAAIYDKYIKAKITELRNTIKENYKKYTRRKKPTSLKDKIIIIADDGIATGNTMKAAIDLIKLQNPKEIIIAVPVASAQAIEKLKPFTDKIICLEVATTLFTINKFYENFEQVEDDEAIRLFTEANKK